MGMLEDDITEGFRDQNKRINSAMSDVRAELEKAMAKFGPMKSGHEGYAVILEELDELWQEIKHGTKPRERKEAVQVAAMAVRYLIDVK